MPMTRHSSCRTRLDHVVLNQRLEDAVSYDRIAGYFRSSLFEVAREAIAKVTGPVRIICLTAAEQEVQRVAREDKAYG